MVREFDRNMFIMLLAVMIGVIVITYFAGDIVNSMHREELILKHTQEIETIESKNINFTTRFLDSMGDLDRARENRANGNYNFDLAFIWYTSALSEKNISNFELYKAWTIYNCDDAVYNYTLSNSNFGVAKTNFVKTKSFTHYEGYRNLLDLYVNLTESGERLTMLRINASLYLRNLADNLTITDGTVGFSVNVSELLDLFNETQLIYQVELGIYNLLEEQIEKEYNILGFSEEREL
jgi:hypothetical protein